VGEFLADAGADAGVACRRLGVEASFAGDYRLDVLAVGVDVEA
jgi:hypothetical protein